MRIPGRCLLTDTRGIRLRLQELQRLKTAWPEPLKRSVNKKSTIETKNGALMEKVKQHVRSTHL